MTKTKTVNAFPTTFKVFSTTWTVKLVKRLPADTVGDCDYLKSEIRILSSLSDELKFRTLFHELLHTAGLGEGAAEYGEVLAGILFSNGHYFRGVK